MNTLQAFDRLFPNALIERLGWVLVHSLWQFALVAFVAGIIVRAMRRNSASARYAVLVAAMVLAAGAPAVTWVLLPEEAANQIDRRVATGAGREPVPASHLRTDVAPLAGSSILANGQQVSASHDSPSLVERSEIPPEIPSAAPSFGQRLSAWLERARLAVQPWLAWIVAGWGLGVVICSLRPLLGWRALWRLPRIGVSPPPDEILATLRRVSAQMGLRRAVRVLGSTLAQAPMVVGYLRPVVLLPVGLLMSMPPAQLEAILAHELAHVQRHDFIVNLLQTLLETLFFYHPAVWWLSRRIRVEREHCCDDLVVRVMSNRVEYGRALIAIEQLRARKTVLAPGAGDGPLLSRVRRLVGSSPDKVTPSLRERWPVALFSLAGLGLLIVLSLSWNLAAQSDRENPRQSSIAALPDDITVELVGVGFHPSKDRDWWEADGGKLEQRPPLEGGVSVMPNSPEQGNCREFYLKIQGLPREHSVSVDYGPVSSATGSRYQDGLWIGEHAAGPFKSETASIRVGLATEPFGSSVTIDVEGKKLSLPELPRSFIAFYDHVVPLRVERAAEQTTLVLASKPLHELDKLAAWELHAFDIEGRGHRASSVEGHPSGEQRFVFTLARDRLSRFEYRLRPYRHWVTFENVSLRPGHETDVRVKTESLPQAARVRVLNRDGSRATFNTIVSASVGFPKPPLKSWVGWPTREGIVSLENLPAGKNWLLAAGDAESRTLFEVELPREQSVQDVRLREFQSWLKKNVEIRPRVEINDEAGEVIHVEIQNPSDERLMLSEADLVLQTAEAGRELLRGLSPRWQTAAREPFQQIAIEPGQSGRVTLNWREWVKNGLWASRDHEDISEPVMPGSGPGKLWLRVCHGNGGALPVSVTDPEVILAAANGFEKAVANLELVFFQDRSRRGLPAIVVSAAGETYALTAGPATIVPDGTPHAIDRVVLEIPGQQPIEAQYDRHSTAEIFVYRAAGEFTKQRLPATVSAVAGDSLTAIHQRGPQGWQIDPDPVKVISLDSEAEFQLFDRKVHHKFKELMAVDRALPEGAPLFKEGRLAGITLLGIRYLGDDSTRSYVVPAERIVALCAGLQKQDDAPPQEDVDPKDLIKPAGPAFILPDHLNVMAVGFDRESQTLVSVATEHDVAIRQWNVGEKKLEREVKLATDQHGNHFLSASLCLSADRSRVLGGLEGQVGIWDTETGRLLKSLNAPAELRRGMGRGLSSTPDLALVACGWDPVAEGLGPRDARAIVWDVASGEVRRIVKHVGSVQVHCVALSPDGKWLATGGQRAGTCVWNVSNGELLYALPNDNPNRRHPDPKVLGEGANQVLCLKFSPDGLKLAIGDMLGVKLVDARSGNLLHSLDKPFRFGRSGLVFSSDGRLLARVATDKTVPIWSARTGKLAAELPTEANDGAFSDDGQWFAAGFSDTKNALAVWRLREGPARAGRENPRQRAGSQVTPQDVKGDDVPAFVLDTLRTHFNPDPLRGSWQEGAHEMQVLSTLAAVQQQDLVVKTLMKVADGTEMSTPDQWRLALTYLAGAAPAEVLPILVGKAETAARRPAPGLTASAPPCIEIEVLGRIGEESRAAIPDLIQLLEHPDPQFCRQVIDSLVKIGPSSPVVMHALARRFNDPQAVYEAGRYGELARPLGPAFVKLLDSESKPIRTWAAWSLVKSGFDDSRGFDVLIGQLAGGASEDRSLAATALAALGSQARPMIPKLRAYENDADERAAKAVREAIRRIEIDDRIRTHAEEAAKIRADREATAAALKNLRAASEDKGEIRTQIDAIAQRFVTVVKNRGQSAFVDDDVLETLRQELWQYLGSRISRPASNDWYQKILTAVDHYCVDEPFRRFTSPKSFMIDFEILKWHLWSAMDRDELPPAELARRESQRQGFRDTAKTFRDPYNGKSVQWWGRDGRLREMTALEFKVNALNEMMSDPLNPYFAWPLTNEDFKAIQNQLDKARALQDLNSVPGLILDRVVERSEKRVRERWPIKIAASLHPGITGVNLFRYDRERANRPLESLKAGKTTPRSESQSPENKLFEIRLLGGDKRVPLPGVEVTITEGYGSEQKKFGPFRTDDNGTFQASLAPGFFYLHLKSEAELPFLAVEELWNKSSRGSSPALNLRVTDSGVEKWLKGERREEGYTPPANQGDAPRVTYTLLRGCELVLRAVDAETGQGLPGATFYTENAVGEEWAHSIDGENLGAKSPTPNDQNAAGWYRTDKDGFFRRLVGANAGFKYGVELAPAGYEAVDAAEVEIDIPYGQLRAEHVFKFRRTSNVARAKPETQDPTLGTLSGRFVYDGEPPTPKDLYPGLAQLEADSPLPKDDIGRVLGVAMTYQSFLQHKIRPVTKDRSLIVSKEGGIANVIVWVTSKEIPWKPPADADLLPVTLRVKNGNYSPRLSVVVPGQPLLVENHDPLDFNFHADFVRNAGINLMLRALSVETPQRFVFRAAEKLPSSYRSDQAIWATGWLFIHGNSFIAVSQEDGSFAIPNLPPGEWEFRVWHERQGFVQHWPKGLFKHKIQPGDNDLGTIKLEPEFFAQKSSEPAKR